ncbi:hypothetical protein DEO72_LG3g935 [Vigna unguiculata]|uniref:Uncharacterized protein n=1 Tax=Vigna unguiculata TaxID=3917 RepID=A0A4D6LD45_VIGUN|nr:hypothetical protein DEO72_LG3g935 [Vigna unguiculata]
MEKKEETKCVVASETSGGGRCRRQHSWPAEIGVALLMVGAGFGSMAERRKINLRGFYFEKKGD